MHDRLSRHVYFGSYGIEFTQSKTCGGAGKAARHRSIWQRILATGISERLGTGSLSRNWQPRGYSGRSAGGKGRTSSELLARIWRIRAMADSDPRLEMAARIERKLDLLSTTARDLNAAAIRITASLG
jgi:hypothetical protein